MRNNRNTNTQNTISNGSDAAYLKELNASEKQAGRHGSFEMNRTGGFSVEPGLASGNERSTIERVEPDASFLKEQLQEQNQVVSLEIGVPDGQKRLK